MKFPLIFLRLGAFSLLVMNHSNAVGGGVTSVSVGVRPSCPYGLAA